MGHINSMRIRGAYLADQKAQAERRAEAEKEDESEAERMSR